MNAAGSTQWPPWLADSAGMFASIACAIHCAAMPLVISYLPMLGLSWLADESFHQVMAVVCFALAVAAFVPGWRRHRSFAPAGIGLVGLTVIAVAAFTLEGECCPTCAAANESSSLDLAITERIGTKLIGLQPIESELACHDENCPHCVAAQAKILAQMESEPSRSAVAQAGEVSSGTAGTWFVPFITPLGGILLIAGHLVNHQKSCRCSGESCCLPPATGAEG